MRTIIVVFLFLVGFLNAGATHLRCGYINLTRTGGLTYEISLLVFTNSNTEIRFGDGELDFGDGSKIYITPTIDNTLRPDLASNVATVFFHIRHTFANDSTYKITYTEANLNEGIINVFNSVETKFYLETVISLGVGEDCSSPDFLVPPIFKQSIGQDYTFSTAASDKNDYLLTYELVNPLKPGNSNYSMPENMSIDYYSGLVTWDTKYKGLFQIGEYLFGVRVSQYNSQRERVGYTIQTFQVILQDVDTKVGTAKPVTDLNGKIVVEDGQERTTKVVLDDTSQSADWIAVYDGKVKNNVTFSQYDSIAGVTKLRVGVFKINSTTDIVRDNPYAVTLRAKYLVSGEVFSKDIGYLLFTKDASMSLVTKVEEPERREIKIYPNPFLSYLRIEANEADAPKQIELLNASGQVALSTMVKGDEALQTSHLPAGFYILRMKTEKGMKMVKITKAWE